MTYFNNLGQGRVGFKSPSGGGGGIDADAQAFITAASITDSTQQSAINTLVTQLKTYGIWTKLKAYYPCVGGTASSHKFNLKDPRDLDAAYRLTFFGGVTHTSEGIVGNGTNAYAYTNLPQNTFELNNMSMGWYNMNDVADSVVNRYAIGSTYSEMQFRFFNSFSSYIQRIGGTTNTFTNSTTQKGMYIMSRQNSTNALAYKNGVLQNTVSQTGVTTSLGSRIFVLFGKDNGSGTAAAPGVSLFGPWVGNSIFFTDGLNSTEVANFYTAVQTFQTTLGRQVGVPIVADSDAQAFLNAAVITNQTQANAINTLVTDLKSANIWTKMKAIYPFVGGTATTHKFNLKDPRDLDAAYRLVFNGGWTHSSTGALPNGTTAYADTKLGANLLQTNNHLSYYSRTSAVNVQVELGVFNNLPSGIINQLRAAGNYLSGQVGGTVSFTTTSSSLGFWAGTKTSDTNRKVYLNGSLQATSTSPDSQTLPSLNLFLGARNKGGTSAELFSTKESAFASIGDGLTDTEATAFYNAVQTYQVALGRQV